MNSQIPKHSQALVYMKTGEVFEIDTYFKLQIGNSSLDIIRTDSKEKIELTSRLTDSIIFFTKEKVKIKGERETKNLKRKYIFYKAKPNSKKDLLVEELVKGKLTVYQHTSFVNGYYSDANVNLYVLKKNHKTLRFTNRFAYHLKKSVSKLMSDCPELLKELKKQKRFSDDDVIDYFNRYNQGCD